MLAKHRGVRNHLDVPKLTVRQILEWADTHKHRTGVWPRETSGPIHDAPGETWSGIHSALHAGGCGLNALAGSTLSQILAKHRGVRQGARLPELTVGQILGWADAHHGRTGLWPRSIPAGRSSGLPKKPGFW
ncbi:MAG: hypothetical protein C0467_32595 [Planctomycetaceae bacterium]|nr:hypothetical protein [Planctomycetaceae bacterium]